MKQLSRLFALQDSKSASAGSNGANLGSGASNGANLRRRKSNKSQLKTRHPTIKNKSHAAAKLQNEKSPDLARCSTISICTPYAIYSIAVSPPKKLRIPTGVPAVNFSMRKRGTSGFKSWSEDSDDDKPKSL